MAIAWACRLSVAEYAAVGKAVDVPRPDCPSCGRPMTFEGSYPRWVRRFPATWRIFIRRARCTACGQGHALLPDFVTLGRRDHVEAIGVALTARVARQGAECPGSGVPAATQRSWEACFAERSAPLAAGLRALIVTYEGQAPRLLDQPMGPPERVAAVCLGAAWDAARRRCARAGLAIVAPWRFANLICGGALMATRVVLRPDVIGMGRGAARRGQLPP